ncbi:MAG: hypothetical protein AB8H03_06335 [Saprospiraceae bacterium]
MKNLNPLLFGILFMLILQIPLFAQKQEVKFTKKNLEQKILTYQPPHREGISKGDFDRGVFILGEVRKDIKKDNLKFTYSDYWNLMTSFSYLKEPQEHIELAFQKAIDNNPESICEYIEAFGDKAVTRLTKSIPEVFLPFYKNCENLTSSERVFDPKNYAKENNFDLELVQLIHQIGEDDQKYRKVRGEIDWSKQTPLDKKNMQLIDSLYNNKHTYIGRSMVGKELESTMWAVIQHSNIETMEKYLPIMHKAVKKGALSEGTIKLTIDRIYCAKYNYQPFGSQLGGSCELSSKEVRQKVIAEYGFK